MKKIINYLKANRVPVPIRVGKLLSRIPYAIRPGVGKNYRIQQKAIQEYKEFSVDEKKNYIYSNFIRVMTHAYTNIKFYNDLYNNHGITPSDINSFDDIKKVPVINKSDLLQYPLEERSFNVKNRVLVNTGGSSGNALSFYMDPLRYGNEWAHIHDMWSKLGFEPKDIRLFFDGRTKRSNKITYDFARNSLLYDIYADPQQIGKQLLTILKKHRIKYLHGYPSAIYEFAVYCETNRELLDVLRNQLLGAFLSSEFPSPHYRDKIEEVFDIKTQSFYGHTETCVMAVESKPFLYDAYQTYGLAECVTIDNSNHLVGTSYFNYASPLIRYDTADLINVESLLNNEILERFTIKEGRSGEFVVDKNQKRIPLTGLIYGRHHKLFNICEHIQISQEEPGNATVFFVSKNLITSDVANTLFSSEGIDIDFQFKQIDRPILTLSGKINLLVRH